MYTNRLNIIIFLLIISVLIFACGSGQLLDLTSTPPPPVISTSTVTPHPTDTQTPLPTATDLPVPSPTPVITIRSSEGALAVTKVEIVERFPPGCEPVGFGCSQAAPGYIILIVWLDKVDGEVSLDSSELINKPIFVTGADGSRTKIFAGGVYNGELFVAFTPPESASGFVLEWPDAPPVDLGQ